VVALPHDQLEQLLARLARVDDLDVQAVARLSGRQRPDPQGRTVGVSRGGQFALRDRSERGGGTAVR